MTANRPSACSTSGTLRSSASRFSSSWFTRIRSAMNVRVAGSIFSGGPGLFGIAARTSSANRCVVVIGEILRASTSFRATRREYLSCASW